MQKIISLLNVGLKNIAIIVIVFIAHSCAENNAKEKQDDPQQLRKELKPTAVKITSARLAAFEYKIETSGKIAPLLQQVFIAETNGFLETFQGANNKTFKRGELIAQFERSSLELELSRAKLNEFNTGLEYKSELLGFSKGNTIPVSDSVKKKLDIATGYGAAKIDLKKAEVAYAKATIVAPFSGRVANVRVQEGSWNKSGDELFTLYSDTELLAEVKVLETDILHIKTGQPAMVVPTAKGNPGGYKANVLEINPMVDEHGLVAVKLKVLNPNGLLPGMNVNAVIAVPQHKTIVVPKSAVVMRSNRPVVFTLEGGLAKWNYVTPGLENEGEVEIVEGVKEGQTVIISNNLQLAHDAPVQQEELK